MAVLVVVMVVVAVIVVRVLVVVVSVVEVVMPVSLLQFACSYDTYGPWSKKVRANVVKDSVHAMCG